LSPQKTAASATATETQLIARAQQGDEEAFAALFEAHKRRVFSLCLRMIGNPTEAEDLTQEAFLQLFRKISTFRGESAFSTWLHRLAVNVVLMHLRKKGLNQISLDETENSQGEPIKRDYGDDDRRLVGSIDRIGLNRAISELPPGYRTVFILHDVEGYEHNEIAEIMNCSIGNSKSQLHKARLKLREWFQQHQSQQGRNSPARAAREAREEQ
jgi:RNA polymerase sigma-70 factor, ECF subfamily